MDFGIKASRNEQTCFFYIENRKGFSFAVYRHFWVCHRDIIRDSCTWSPCSSTLLTRLMTVPPCYDEDDDDYAGNDEHDGGDSCTLLLNVVEQLSGVVHWHQLCTLHCELRAAINYALSTLHCALCTVHCELCTAAIKCALCTVHFALCTVHCHQMKTKCGEIQSANQHCCSADARSTYKLFLFLLFFQGNRWAIFMKTNIYIVDCST